MAQIEIQNLTFSYPSGRSALSDVNLTIHRGE